MQYLWCCTVTESEHRAAFEASEGRLNGKVLALYGNSLFCSLTRHLKHLQLNCVDVI